MPARIEPGALPELPTLEYEEALWRQGMRRPGGVDEAGRGAWAGPVAAAVVILPPEAGLEAHLHGVRDSKQITPLQRERWAGVIRQVCLGWGVGLASANEIDTLGILHATHLAVRRALQNLAIAPDHLLTDYLLIPEVDLPQTSLVKGDRRSLSIAAASVLAKTRRDDLMREMEQDFPAYGFAQHKGYGTPQHQQAIRNHGLCPQHRKTFHFMK